MKKNYLIVMLIAIMILFLVSTLFEYKILKKEDVIEKQAEIMPEFSIETKDNNVVLLKFYNELGIQEIKYPDGFTVFGNGKNKISVDWEVSKNQRYDFILKDTDNTEKTYTFYAPEAHVELAKTAKSDMNIELETVIADIKNNLDSNLIATSFIEVNTVTGKKESADSNTTNLREILNNWNEIGTTGKWNVVSESSLGKDVLRNTANQDKISGFYSPKNTYTDIDFSFKSAPNDSDNDMIGIMR